MKNISKYLLSFIVIIIFGLSAIGSADTNNDVGNNDVVNNKLQSYRTNEPTGWGNIKWGTDINKFKNMELIDGEGENKYYIKKDDKLDIYSVKIDKIEYRFHNGKFSSVYISYKEYANFKKINKQLSQQYGNGSYLARNGMERYVWGGSVDGINYEGKYTYIFHLYCEEKCTLTFESLRDMI